MLCDNYGHHSSVVSTGLVVTSTESVYNQPNVFKDYYMIFSCFRSGSYFSPFEIGIAKYGTFMKTQDFGCKFIVGKKIKHFDEFPLHFLQGESVSECGQTANHCNYKNSVFAGV